MSSKSSYSTILRYTRVLAALGSVVAGIRHSCSGYAGFWPWFLAAGPRRQENAKTRVDRRSTRDFALYRCFGRAGLCRGRNPAYSCSGYAGFWPWLLAAGPRRQENAKTRVDRRSTRDFALYRCFGRAGLCRGRNHAYSSCSGGLRPWLLAAAPQRQENAKTRVDRRSTRDFALYQGFSRAGLCRGRNPA